MWVTKHKNIFFTISSLLVGASLFMIVVFGLNFGIDFTGGSILEVTYDDRPTIEEVEESLTQFGLESFSVRSTDEGGLEEERAGYIIRTSFLEEGEQSELLNELRSESPGLEVTRSSTIGPSVGSELADKAMWAIAVVVLAIIVFVAFAFRHVSEPVSSWKYGAVAIVALLHDTIIPTGVFALMGQITGAQIDILFVLALLTILGYSVNDTIVVFDRTRENLRTNQEEGKHENFDHVVGRSLSETFTRSINTSLTTLFVLGSLYLIGGESTQLFALVLIIGVISGTYSSIFLASPLLLQVKQWQKESE